MQLCEYQTNDYLSVLLEHLSVLNQQVDMVRKGFTNTISSLSISVEIPNSYQEIHKYQGYLIEKIFPKIIKFENNQESIFEEAKLNIDCIKNRINWLKAQHGKKQPKERKTSEFKDIMHNSDNVFKYNKNPNSSIKNELISLKESIESQLKEMNTYENLSKIIIPKINQIQCKLQEKETKIHDLELKVNIYQDKLQLEQKYEKDQNKIITLNQSINELVLVQRKLQNEHQDKLTKIAREHKQQSIAKDQMIFNVQLENEKNQETIRMLCKVVEDNTCKLKTLDDSYVLLKREKEELVRSLSILTDENNKLLGSIDELKTSCLKIYKEKVSAEDKIVKLDSENEALKASYIKSQKEIEQILKEPAELSQEKCEIEKINSVQREDTTKNI